MQNDILHDGKVFFAEKKYKKALGFFLGLPSDTSADKIEIAYYLGLCYAKLQRYDDALVFLEQVVTSGAQLERTLQCRFLLAVIYALSGRKRLADFELNKLLETGYMTPSVDAAIAYIAWEQNDSEKCLKYYEESLKKDPGNITALNGLGYVLASTEKDLSRALSLCKQAVKVSPKSAACLDSLGFVYYKLGMYKDALKYMEQAEELDNSSVEILNHIKIVKKEMYK